MTQHTEETALPNLFGPIVERWDQSQAVKEERQQNFLDWARRVPEPKSGTLDFERFPFQVELYEHPQDKEMVVKKGTQAGISALLVRWTMFWADTRGYTALYVFPKRTQLYDFSDSRIRPLILNSEYLRARVPGNHVQNKGLKQVGLGFIYYRGSESKDDLDAVDADILALDEYDTLNQANIPDAERRIGGSLIGLIRRVGVPSIPDWGISKLYDESDRRKWHVKCERCNEWQYLTFHENVDQETAQRICRKCTKPIDVRKGQWVAEHPDRDVRGYHVPRLIVPGADIKAIIAASKKRAPYEVQVHHNKDLGEAYAPEEGRLSKEAIAAAQREFVIATSAHDGGYNGSNPVTMGVDVASVRDLNVRISEHLDAFRKRALWIGPVENFDVLVNLMERYNVNMACIDHLPEGRLARSFAERFAGRVYVVNYATAGQADVLKIDEEQRRVSVRRVEAIDATNQMIREQRNTLPLNLPENYVSHMQSNVRIVEKDELGKVTTYYRSTADDDYAQAEVYDLVAAQCWWIRQHIEETQREVLQPLDNLMEFQRAEYLTDEDRGMEYHEGPDENMDFYEEDDLSPG